MTDLNALAERLESQWTTSIYGTPLTMYSAMIDTMREAAAALRSLASVEPVHKEWCSLRRPEYCGECDCDAAPPIPSDQSEHIRELQENGQALADSLAAWKNECLQLRQWKANVERQKPTHWLCDWTDGNLSSTSVLEEGEPDARDWTTITPLFASPPPIPEGMVLVPREPTEAMLEAAAIYRDAMVRKDEPFRHGGMYRAMITAAEGK